MGCAACQPEFRQKTLDLDIPEEGFTAGSHELFPEPTITIEPSSAKTTKSNLHMPLKESKPNHVKLATDRGRPLRKLVLSSKDDILLTNHHRCLHEAPGCKTEKSPSTTKDKLENRLEDRDFTPPDDEAAVSLKENPSKLCVQKPGNAKFFFRYTSPR